MNWDEAERLNTEDGCIEDLTDHICFVYHDEVCADGQRYLAKDSPDFDEFLCLVINRINLGFKLNLQ